MVSKLWFTYTHSNQISVYYSKRYRIKTYSWENYVKKNSRAFTIIACSRESVRARFSAQTRDIQRHFFRAIQPYWGRTVSPTGALRLRQIAILSFCLQPYWYLAYTK